MSSEQESFQRPDQARIERDALCTAIVVVIGVSTVAVLLHLLWPTVVWLRALACGLVVLLGELLLTSLIIRITQGRGSIVNFWTIVLPIIAGFSSVEYGWSAPMWTLGVLAGFYVTGVLYYFLVVKRTARRDKC